MSHFIWNVNESQIKEVLGTEKKSRRHYLKIYALRWLSYENNFLPTSPMNKYGL